MFLMNAFVTACTKLKRDAAFIFLSAVVLAVVANIDETSFYATSIAIFAAKIYLDMGGALMSEAVQVRD